MVIVDEAGQLTEPLTLGLILRGRRFVLVGDDRQLPPVVRTRGLAQSMFERLKQEAESTNSGSLTLARYAIPDASADHVGVKPVVLRWAVAFRSDA